MEGVGDTRREDVGYFGAGFGVEGVEIGVGFL